MGVRNSSPEAMARARELRLDQSLSERRMWSLLKNRQLGFRFRRQFSVGPYVLDFYCHEARLCVEVDGDQHAYRGDADARRDAFLAERGILTYRVHSLDIPDQRLGLARYIQHLCVERTGRSAGSADLSTPSPTLPRDAGEGGPGPSAA